MQWIELRMSILAIAQTRVRYDYRMIRLLLKSRDLEGWQGSGVPAYTRKKVWGYASAQLARGVWDTRAGAVQANRAEPGLGYGLRIRSAL